MQKCRFSFFAGLKIYSLIDSHIVRMQWTKTIFARITYTDVTNWLSSSTLLFWLPGIFGIRCNYTDKVIDHEKPVRKSEEREERMEKHQWVNNRSSPRGRSFSIIVSSGQKKSTYEKRKELDSYNRVDDRDYSDQLDIDESSDPLRPI